jgi:hypothetical protein
MSITFKKHRNHFREAYNSIWKELPADAKMTLQGLNPRATLNSQGQAIKVGLDYFKSLGGFSSDITSVFDELAGLRSFL